MPPNCLVTATRLLRSCTAITDGKTGGDFPEISNVDGRYDAGLKALAVGHTELDAESLTIPDDESARAVPVICPISCQASWPNAQKPR